MLAGNRLHLAWRLKAYHGKKVDIANGVHYEFNAPAATGLTFIFDRTTYSSSNVGITWVGKPGGGLLDRYVIETRGGSGQLASNTETVVGRTALMVVKAQFMPGVDIFTLYTNPLPNRPEPAKGLVKSDIDLGVVSAIGIYSTGAFSIDEIRIGTTYADVLPTSHPGGRDLFEGCDDDDDRDEHHRR